MGTPQSGSGAGSEARRSARLSGECAVDLLDVGRDEVLDPELARDRRGDEAIRGGHDRADRSRMRRDEIHGALADDRADLALHEILVPCLESLARMLRERRELEREELVDVERAVLVALREPEVLRVELRRMKDPFLDEELGPFDIAVAFEERVVEVEERELHAAAPNAALSSGTVTARPVSSE